MKIKLDDEYMISSDEYGWQIRKYLGVYKTGKHEGEENWKIILWYTDFDKAVQGLAQRLIRLSEAQTLVDALKDVDNVCKRLTSAFNVEVSNGK